MIGFAAMGAGLSLWQSTNSALLLRLAGHEKDKGAMLGINGSITALGMLGGAIAAGEVATEYGYGATFGLSTIFLAASFLILSRFHGMIQPKLDLAQDSHL
jgi:MFS family permease